MHARRYFYKALESDEGRMGPALHLIARLYRVEERAKALELTAEQRRELRRRVSSPVMERLHAYLLELKQQVLPKSPSGAAVRYALNQWQALNVYLEDGELEIDNGATERAKDPSILLKMLSHDFPFDTVHMPLNCLDATFRSFESNVLPEVNRRGMAALGMKSLGGSGELVSQGAVVVTMGLRYAMSLPVAVTISGIESVSVPHQNLGAARGFQPFTAAEMQAIRDACRFGASDGPMELFKATRKYDGDLGCEMHGFPSSAEFPV